MKVTVLGTGRWASNIVGLLLKNNHQVMSWERVFNDNPESDFFKFGKNTYIDLSKAKNEGKLKFTHDLKEALGYSDIVIISILSQAVDELMQSIKQIDGYKNKVYTLAMKGLESTTGRTLSEILMDNGIGKKNIVALAGPGHVQSIAAGMITHMVVAGYDTNNAEKIQKLLSNKNFKLFISPDVKGVEICAAAKNVYGSLAGICVGTGNDTLRGSLMCASLAEMEQYLTAMECTSKTARRLALLGDYDATLYDKNSHNLNYGIEVAKQNTINPKLPFVSVEGRYAVNGLIKRMTIHNNQVSDKMQLKAPLLETFADIVEEKIAPKKAISAMNEAIEEIYSLDE